MKFDTFNSNLMVHIVIIIIIIIIINLISEGQFKDGTSTLILRIHLGPSLLLILNRAVSLRTSVISSHLRLVRPNGLFLSSFHTTYCMHISPVPCVARVPLLLISCMCPLYNVLLQRVQIIEVFTIH